MASWNPIFSEIILAVIVAWFTKLGTIVEKTHGVANNCM